MALFKCKLCGCKFEINNNETVAVCEYCGAKQTLPMLDYDRREKLKAAKAGDYVLFGKYEQDNNTTNGKEDIEWLVLEVTNGKALVISKYALDCRPYNKSRKDVEWETCTLREWLNNDFLNSAFSADEKAMIPTVTASAHKNPEFDTFPGYKTLNQVFLLSITEARNYFHSDNARRCEPTDFAVANGALKYGSCECLWWLRSPGHTKDSAAFVDRDGEVNYYGDNVNRGGSAVRPALWIDLNS